MKYVKILFLALLIIFALVIFFFQVIVPEVEKGPKLDNHATWVEARVVFS